MLCAGSCLKPKPFEAGKWPMWGRAAWKASFHCSYLAGAVHAGTQGAPGICKAKDPKLV